MARFTETICTAMYNLFRTRTLASRAEFPLELIRLLWLVGSTPLTTHLLTTPYLMERPGQAFRGSKYLNKGRPRQQGQGDGGRRLFLKFRRVHGILKAMKAPATTKADPPPLEIDEDKLAHALVARGLVTPEEIQTGRAARSKGNLLVRLVALGHLAPSQARRVYQELLAQLNQQIPGYELLEKLGQGSMGMVYKARQLSMNRLVAIKVLHPRLAADPKYLERFTQEAHIAARLNHNNVVQAIDVGSIGSLNYFIMGYGQGTTIKAALAA